MATITKAQNSILEALRMGAVLSTNASSARTFTQEAWIDYGVGNGSKRVSIASVSALEAMGLIVSTQKDWNGAIYKIIN